MECTTYQLKIPLILIEDYEMKLYEDQKEANERTQLLPKKPRDKQRQNSDSDDVTDVVYPLLPQLCASLISCLNTLSSGITVSYTSPAIPELRLPSQPSGVEFGDDETALFAAMIGQYMAVSTFNHKKLYSQQDT